MDLDINNDIVKKQEYPIWGLIIVLISIGLFFFYLKIQPPITYDFSPLFDGNEYLKIYHYFNGETDHYNVSFPYHSRIMVPFLASLMPFKQPVNNFHAINLIFLILSIGMIYILWREYKIPLDVKFLGFFLLLFHWAGIIRHNIFDPVTVDVPIYFFEALILWLVVKRKFCWLILVAPLSVLNKEVFIALLIIIWLYFAIIPLTTSQKRVALLWISIALILTVSINIITNNFFPPAEGGKSSIMTLLISIKGAIVYPFKIIRWLTGIFVSFGIYLMISLLHRIKKSSIRNEEALLIFISVFYLGLSFLGGGDFTRLVFLGFPFIVTWILLQFKEIPNFFFKVAIFASIPLMKLFRNIPDPASDGWQKFYNWFPEFAPPLLDVLWLLYGVGAFFLIRQLSRKLSIKI